MFALDRSSIRSQCDRWKVEVGWRPGTKRLTLEVEAVSKQRQTDIGRMGGNGDRGCLANTIAAIKTDRL